MLEQDSSEKVQAVAATALGKFALLAELRKLRPSHKSRISQALLTIIHTPGKSVEVKRRALEATAPLSLPQIKQAIMAAYHSGNPGLKTSAIFAMGRSCNRSWLPILLKELTSGDTELRYEAAGACGELGEKEAVSYLIELVSDPDIEVQLVAIKALGKIGAPEAKGCLEQCLDNPNEIIQQAAEQALYELEAGGEPLSFRF
jgi:HEAT repeat protein